MPSSRVLLFLMFLGFAVVTKVQGEIKIFDVTKYGAIGDGRIDNTKVSSYFFFFFCGSKALPEKALLTIHIIYNVCFC